MSLPFDKTRAVCTRLVLQKRGWWFHRLDGSAFLFFFFRRFFFLPWADITLVCRLLARKIILTSPVTSCVHGPLRTSPACWMLQCYATVIFCRAVWLSTAGGIGQLSCKEKKNRKTREPVRLLPRVKRQFSSHSYRRHIHDRIFFL
jgi:hypothetical protein